MEGAMQAAARQAELGTYLRYMQRTITARLQIILHRLHEPCCRSQVATLIGWKRAGDRLPNLFDDLPPPKFPRAFRHDAGLPREVMNKPRQSLPRHQPDTRI